MQQLKDYIPLITAIFTVTGGIIGIYLAHRFAAVREMRAKRDTAATGFLEAIYNQALIDAPTLAVYVFQNLNNNIRFIDDFRRFVPARSQKAYDKAKEDYCKACQPYKNIGPLSSFAINLSPNAETDKQAIISAIEKLRLFTC